MAFCISESHILECYVYHPGEEQWKEIKLGGLGDTIVHDESNLGAILTSEGMVVLYQAPDNTLRGIMNKGASWEPLGQLSDQALPGTPIVITSSAGISSVFYVNKDNNLQYQPIHSAGTTGKTIPSPFQRYISQPKRRRKFGTLLIRKTLAGKTLQNSQFDLPVTRIKVVQNEETKQVATYVLTEDGHIYLLDQDGNVPTDIGYIENEQFEAAKSAQAVLVNWWFPPPVPVWQDWVPVTNWVPRTWIGW
jgi:hypothetical protein